MTSRMVVKVCDCIMENSGYKSLEVAVGGRFLCNSLVGRLSKSNPDRQVQAIHSDLFLQCPLHCCTHFCFFFNFFWFILYLISASYCGLALLCRKTILVVSSTFCRNSRCKCLYIVQHLYKYLLSALLGDTKNNRGISNCSIIFLCKKKKKEKIFKNGLKRIGCDLDMVFRSCTEK